MSTQLTAIAAIVAGLCSSDSFAQFGPRATRQAAAATNQPASSAAASQPAPPAVTPQPEQLLEQLDSAIEVTSKRYLTANVHSPWQIFHGILAMKRDFQLKLGEEKVNALEWIATSEPRFDNQPLLLKTAHGGKFHPFTRPWAFEGHPSQFLALMSQSDLPNDYSFKVGDEKITLADMVQNTMKEVNSKEEVTWVLWALQHHLAPNAQWVNQFGEPWSIEKLVQIETAAPVVGAACGGNHRLFALTRTRDKHLKLGGKLDGVWAQADLKIRQHVELARQLQNSDGSFSSKFYQAPGYTNDLNERFNTTGHTLEFLSIGLPANRLTEPWVLNAATLLSRELVQYRQRQIDCGPLYHSLNSLMIYRERLRKLMPESIASKAIEPTTTTSVRSLESKTAALANSPVATTTKKGFEAVTPPAVPEIKKLTESVKAIETTTGSPKLATAAKGGEALPVATQQPTTVPVVTVLKTIDPGRVVHLQPIQQPLADNRPKLPTNIDEGMVDEFVLPFRDPDSYDSTVGTLKPRFNNPPPASRAAAHKTNARPVSTITISSPAVLVDGDEPVSADKPVNR